MDDQFLELASYTGYFIINKQKIVKEGSNMMVLKIGSTHTLTNSDGHNIKLISVPENAAEGIIICSCGEPLCVSPVFNKYIYTYV